MKAIKHTVLSLLTSAKQRDQKLRRKRGNPGDREKEKANHGPLLPSTRVTCVFHDFHPAGGGGAASAVSRGGGVGWGCFLPRKIQEGDLFKKIKCHFALFVFLIFDS